jgi:hypothetical protein
LVLRHVLKAFGLAVFQTSVDLLIATKGHTTGQKVQLQLRFALMSLRDIAKGAATVATIEMHALLTRKHKGHMQKIGRVDLVEHNSFAFGPGRFLGAGLN